MKLSIAESTVFNCRLLNAFKGAARVRVHQHQTHLTLPAARTIVQVMAVQHQPNAIPRAQSHPVLLSTQSGLSPLSSSHAEHAWSVPHGEHPRPTLEPTRTSSASTPRSRWTRFPPTVRAGSEMNGPPPIAHADSVEER